MGVGVVSSPFFGRVFGTVWAMIYEINYMKLRTDSLGNTFHHVSQLEAKPQPTQTSSP